MLAVGKKANSMVDITDSRKPAFLGAEFNEFLFASIGADASGMYLTVVSALARLDLDPWTEAASLARLPKAIATQKLAELVSRFPEIPSVIGSSATIAARLAALLPGRIRGTAPTPKITIQELRPAVQVLMAPRFVLSLLFITLAAMLGTQMVITQFHAPSKPDSVTQTVSSSNADVKVPPVGDSDVGINVN